MTKLAFTKMHGCGNDYIYFNGFTQTIPQPEKLSITLSDRRFGIGSDGIILILPSEKSDAKMRIFNADGSEAKMCGNGIRCVAKYVKNNILKTDAKNCIIDTLAGIKTIYWENDDLYTVDMGEAILNPKDIPTTLAGDKIINYPYTIAGAEYRLTCVSMGNPHVVIFENNLEALDLEKLGPQFETNPIFPEQVNTEWVRIRNKTHIDMRVWERGSGETFACGTGACASVVAAVLNGHCDYNTEIRVSLIGGDLFIRYEDTGKVWMSGPATEVFTGEFKLEEMTK